MTTKTLTLLTAALLLAAPIHQASAATTSASPGSASHRAARHWKGTIPVTGHHAEDELKTMAKVSEEDARKTAMAAIPGDDANKTVGESELEVEHGYLVWSYDVTVNGKKGLEEILVDAGSGAVLHHAHETPAGEAHEAKMDAKMKSDAKPKSDMKPKSDAKPKTKADADAKPKN